MDYIIYINKKLIEMLINIDLFFSTMKKKNDPLLSKKDKDGSCQEFASIKLIKLSKLDVIPWNMKPIIEKENVNMWNDASLTHSGFVNASIHRLPA